MPNEIKKDLKKEKKAHHECSSSQISNNWQIFLTLNPNYENSSYYVKQAKVISKSPSL